jgi:GT2 family glycosyltransferase/2-polyprenyl-3-methyl-5-hydroxy-6-metoxy-1,4-benzoquinol methylase
MDMRSNCVSSDLKKDGQNANTRCYVCGKNRPFAVKEGFSLREALCVCCGASRRNSDLAKIIVLTYTQNDSLSLEEVLPQLSNLKIYETQAAGPIHDRLSTLPGYIASEFFDDIQKGMVKSDGVQCEDLQQLSFPDDHFDLVITQDVLEHVPEPGKALKEIQRVLKPGGYHIFTVPYHEGRKTETRIAVEDGTDLPLLPRIYHGDPLREEGALVYTDFGMDITDIVDSHGFITEVFPLSQWYRPNEIPIIDGEESYERYLTYYNAKTLSEFFTYNSVVFRSQKMVDSGKIARLEWTGERYLPKVPPEVCGAEIHFEHQHRYAFAAQFVKGKDVLDLASGEGYGSYTLSKVAHRVVGIEIDPTVVSHAQNTYIRSNLEFKVGDILDIPISDDKLFDVIICFEAIEHIDDHDRLLAEIKRLLRDDGIVIISTPNKILYSDEPEFDNPYHLRELYFQEFKELLERDYSQVVFFGQKVMSGSRIWNIYPTPGTQAVDYSLVRNSDSFSFTDEEASPQYYVAVAGMRDLKDISMIRSFCADSSDAILKQKRHQYMILEEAYFKLEGFHKGQTETLTKLRSDHTNLEGAYTRLEEFHRKQTDNYTQLMAEHADLTEASTRLDELHKQQIEEYKKLRADYADIESTLAIRDEELTVRNKERELLKSDYLELETAYYTLNQEMERKERTTQEVSIRLQDVEGALSRSNNEIERLWQENMGLKSSVSHRFMTKFHSIFIEPLLPPQSRRRATYDRFLKGSRMLFSEGPGATFSEYQKYRAGRRGIEPGQRSAVPLNRSVIAPEKMKEMKEEISRFTSLPTISIITPVYNVDEEYLRACIESVRDQVYENWELCLVDDASLKRHVRRVLREYEGIDDRIKIAYNTKNSGISETTNRGIKMSTGEYVAFLDNDDLLARDALFEVVKLINEHPDADAIYSDEDKISPDGQLCEPFFKPDWSPEYFRGVMYVGHLLTVRKRVAEEAGLINRVYDRVQDYEFMLRVSEKTDLIYHIPKILYHWRKIEGSVASSVDSKGDISPIQAHAVTAHLKRIGLPADAEPGSLPHRAAIVPSGRDFDPLVSIIIPTKDRPDLIGRCLASIFGETTYPRFEVIVIDNQTTDPEAERIIASYPVTIVSYDQPFNFSMMNNYGARSAKGDYLVFLNNDTEIVTKDWIEHLLYYVEQPDVAAAGPLLLYPDKRVQHAGVVLGLRGTADHVMRYHHPEWDGYAGSLSCAREVSAVTAACMMVQASVFFDCGGFNEYYEIHYQDVDLCLKFIAAGYRIIFTPRVLLTHFECATRGRQKYNLIDRYLLIDQWEEMLCNDKYYNKNFDCSVYTDQESGYTVRMRDEVY